MRAFIAIDLPENLKNKLKLLQEDLKRYDLEVKWVKPENIHLTLKFLGNIDERTQVPRIKDIINRVSSNTRFFEATLEGFGFFPNEKNPRVFFVKITRQGLLKSIANQLEQRLQNLGFPIEGRFSSHLTLARIKNPKNIELLKEKIKDVKLKEILAVKEIILYKSTLTASGPIYERISSSPLAA